MMERPRAVAMAMAVALLAVLPALAIGCGAPPSGAPEVSWGVDECSRCRMIVTEPRFAAVARGPAGEEARFDDQGCLDGFLEERAEAGRWQAWLHDFETEAWLPAAAAWRVRAPELATPMGSGLVAFGDQGRALEFAAGREAAAAAAIVRGSSPAALADDQLMNEQPTTGQGGLE